jgi:ribosomal protein L18E
VTANNKMKTYGQVNPTLTATVVGQVVGGDAINYSLATGATQFSNVGTYAITVTLGLNPNYSVTKTDGTLTINQANATLTAADKSKIYGQANPALTAVVVGQVVGGDPINYSLATSATQFSNVGPYAITVTLGLNPNYSVTKTDGTLTINQATATVTAANKSKAYLAANPTLTATVVGQIVGGDPVNYTLATTATQTSFPGTYPITVTLGSNPNYSVTKTDGTLTIGYGACTGPNGPGGVILQPIDADGSSIFPKAGRTVPVKFTVCDANGNSISNPAAVFAGTGGQLDMLSAVRGQVPNPDESAFNDIPDAAFRYSNGIWIFNMATSNLQQNTTYTFRINLAYGNITFVIKIK